ncbi:Ig-like domain-containing protein [Brevibacillus ginsengisoli]|uniref:Ig-like domain-containing protein n=1 Tax=Brevibacillus ginsengisoli TaxID=363854 RepID=UPI003CFAD6A9
MNQSEPRIRLWSRRLGSIFLAFLIAMMSFMSTEKTANAASSTWTTVGSMPPPNVYSIVDVNGTLYSGTWNNSNDVWSYSNGMWTQISGSPSNVVSLLNVNGTLYAGANDGVWSYSNGTWKKMSGSLSNVQTLVEVDGTLYAGTENGGVGVWSYSNGEWTPMDKSPGYVRSLVEVNGMLYAGTRQSSNGVWSYSNGEWTPIDKSPSYVRSLVGVKGTLYAGTENGGEGVWSYSNSTWTQMSKSPGNVRSLLTVKDTLYVGTQYGYNDVWSYNNDTWKQMSGSPGGVYSMVEVNGTLYAGTQSGRNDIWSYSNGTWSGSPSEVYSLLEVNGKLYAGVWNNGNNVWSYSNGTWTIMNNSPGNVISMLLLNGTLYAGTWNGSNDVWSYSNGTWTSMDKSPSNVYSLLNVNDTLYAGTWNGNNGVWSYSNGTWKQMEGSPSNVFSLLNVNGTLYAGTENNEGVWSYSNDTWKQMDKSPSNVHSLINVNGTLYAGANDGVWSYSNDTWTPMKDSPSNVYSLRYVGGTLYASTDDDKGVWSYSNDTWTPMSGSTSGMYTLLQAGGTLYAGGYYGVGQFVLPVPDVLDNLQAGNTTTTTTTLTWNAVSGATGYNIYENGGKKAIATVSSPTHTVNGLTPGTVYTFTVKALNETIESAQSSAIDVWTVPNAPIDLTATTKDSQVALSWSSVTGATSYKVYRGTSSGSYDATPVATVTSETTYTATGLTNGTKYYFVVVASNTGGDSVASNEASAMPIVSSDATLNGLALSSGTLSPGFSSGRTSYVSSVPNNVSSLTVSASVANVNATMTVNGNLVGSGQPSGAIPLKVGSNAIYIVVTAQDNTVKTYTIDVTRAQPSLPSPSPSYYPVTDVSLNPTELSLTAGGETSVMHASIKPSYATNQSVTWSSSNPQVAKVSSDGVVTPLAPGTATITVTTVDQAKTATCKVNVVEENKLVGFEASEDTILLKPNQSSPVTLYAVYSNGTKEDITKNKEVKYRSSSKTIATVTKGVIKAGRKEGEATITVTYQGKKVEISVVISMLDVTKLELKPTNLQLGVGQEEQLQLTATLSNKKTVDVTKRAKWSTSDPDLASVDPTGKVKAIAPGTAVIKAIYGGKTSEMSVKVGEADQVKRLLTSKRKVTIAAGKKQAVKLTAYYENNSKKIVTEQADWSSEDEAVATVEHGVISGVAKGTVKINATYQGKTVTITVTVAE